MTSETRLPCGSLSYKHRETGERYGTSTTYYAKDNNGNCLSTRTTGTFTDVTDIDFRAMYGYNTRCYHKLVEQGALLPHTPFGYYQAVGQARGSYDVSRSAPSTCPHHGWVEPSDKWVYPLRSVLNPGPLLDEGSVLAVMSSYDASYYVQQAAASAYSQGMDVLTFVAELHKTIDMFRNFLRNLIRNMPIVPPGYSTKGGGIHNLWLEARYGWRQVWFDMNDINDAFLALKHKRTRIEARAGNTHVDSSVSYADFTMGSVGVTGTLQINDVKEIGLRGAISADFSPPAFSINPLATAWEIIPWSFVVDWIVNIGGLISALSFVTFSDKYYASAGYKVQWTRDITLHSVSFNPSVTYNWHGTIEPNSHVVATYSRRSPASVPLRPLPHVRLDTFKIIDLIALVLQQLLRLK